MTLHPYLDRLPLLDIAATLSLLIGLVLARIAAGHAIRARTEAQPQLQRRWTANVRNLLIVLGLIGLVMIWAPQLRTFALSLTAVAVAVVIATKELLLCVSGSFLRASTRSFSVGDWIEVAGVRGEVIDHDVLVTTLHEFQPGTFGYSGRTAVVPNSALLGQVMRNDSLTRDFAYHRFSLTVDPSLDVFARRREVEDMVAGRYAAFAAQAARANEAIERRFRIDLPDDLVRVDFRTSDLGKYRIEIALFCPVRAAEALENDVTCDVMSFLHALGRTPPDPAAAADPPAPAP
jgi:small-conductance mechanosensitive channel